MLKTMNIELTYEQKSALVVADYQAGMKVKDIMKKYSYKTARSVYRIINQHNIKNNDNVGRVSKHDLPTKSPIKVLSHQEVDELVTVNNRLINHVYDPLNFELLDAEWKAYLIGLLLTDGCITVADTIILSLTDEDAIKYIANKLGKNYFVRHYDRPKQIINNICERKDIYTVSFSNKVIIEQLKRFGIFKNKSVTLTPPNLYPEEYKYLPYIMQGIIDGDGCVLHTGRMFHIVCTSDSFLAWCRDVFEQWFGMKKLHLYNINYHSGKYGVPFYRLDTAIQGNMKILKNDIYANNIGMQRKGNILQEKVIW